MGMSSENAEWYLKRVNEMLVMAEAAHDEQSRTILLRMAKDYESLAAIEAARALIPKT
jgi:hypothetical protein